MAQIQKTREGVFKKFPLFISQFILSLVSILLTFYGGYYYCDFIPVPTSVDLSSRLAFSLRCSLPMVVVLFLSIVIVGNKRAVTAAVDPLSGNESIVQLDKNFLTNTLEQFAVAFTIILTAATYLETPQELKLLPIYATVFVLSRIIFRIGYGLNPWLRTAGMVGNFYSTILMCGILVYLILTRGFLHGLGAPPLPPHIMENRDEL